MDLREEDGAITDAAVVEGILTTVRRQVTGILLDDIPDGDPPGLYDLVSAYPSRPGKSLRPALCLATCAALGGDPARAMNTAVAIELFHNGFLIHDDIQDQSESRRGAPTLQADHGVSVALNVGNATNLLGLQRLMRNRRTLGSELSWRILQETELMLRHSLEGQAIELQWIRENVCDLVDDDYYRMCLKKTSWYTCVYPCRIGVLVAKNGRVETAQFDRYGWYLGAAFQIQDDILNLVGDYDRYGKEIAGDLLEGKRTMMIIDLLRQTRGADRQRLEAFLAKSRAEREADDVRWLLDRLIHEGCIDRAHQRAQELARAARVEAVRAFADAAPSPSLDFLLALPDYMVERDR
ncbi:MAG: polyprenyl synthetase family protein [Ilumatobacteraceae bacterium]